jgi:uncharacterized membrane protein YkoI
MRARKKWLVGTTIAVVAIGAGTAIAAGRVVAEEKPLRGATLDKASKAALDHTGGGEVVDTETGDDGAAYGVEVRTKDGRQVEVSLDAGFRVVGTEADDGDTDAADED